MAVSSRKLGVPSGIRRTTLKDIATMAGVSVSTASLVLAGKSADRRISREVEERVRQIAQEKDYNPNLLVQSMQRGRTHVISFYNAFRNRERNDHYMDRLSTAILRAAGAQGYDVLTYCDFSRPTDIFYRHINGGLSDGLLFFGPYEDDPLLPFLRESRLPTVLLLHEDSADKLCSVVEDVQEGIRQLASQLVAQGHRRISVFVTPAGTRDDSRRRAFLLRDALQNLNVELPDDRIIQLTSDANLIAELQRPDRPTALFCWHDRMGYAVLETCHRLGIRIPEDLTVIGYDGLHWPSTSPHILTSVAVDIDNAATQAIELLNAQIIGEPISERVRLLPVCWEPGTTFGLVPV